MLFKQFKYDKFPKNQLYKQRMIETYFFSSALSIDLETDNAV